MTLARTPWAALQGVATGTGVAFLGIRYGAPPLGRLRWRAPAPWRPDDGRYDATAYGPSPPQSPSPATPWRPAFTPRAMSEDCLNLNVCTPAADGARRPVLVHVFGGGFETGSASEGLQHGEALSAQGDVVVVRVNFRIGALGFLALGDEAPANRGLLDLALALGWVAENIGALGGDPDNVTLFGLSSGAFMIAALLAMPGARLFARAWMQSGSASRVLTRAQGDDVRAEFLREAGVGDLQALDALPIATLLAAQRKAAALDLGDRNAPGGRTLGIVEDGTSLPEHPMQALRRGAARATPLVLGYTRDEARLWFASGAMRLPASFDETQAEMVRFAGEADGARLFAFYRARWPQADPAGLREAFLSDAVYAIPAARTAQAQTGQGGGAYLYRFDWTPAAPHAALGAAHGFDEAFVWNNPAAFPLADAAAPALAAEMSSSLLAFARTGEPGWAAFRDGAAPRVFGGPADARDDAGRARVWEGVEKR